MNLYIISQRRGQVFIDKNILHICGQQVKSLSPCLANPIGSSLAPLYSALSLNLVYLATQVSSILSVGPLLCLMIDLAHARLRCFVVVVVTIQGK